jgi:hypothetical protein
MKEPQKSPSILQSLPLPLGLLILARLAALMAMPIDGLHGFGDFVTFYRVAQIKGWPYLNFWVEFPPIFPFISGVLFRLAGGREYVYDYLLAFLLLLADAGSLVVLVSLAYTWWYFDPLAVFFLLLSVTLLLEGRDIAGGAALAAGILTKFFPVLILVMVWRYFTRRRAVMISAITIGIVILVFAALYVVSPDFTRASLASQGSKGSWETVWALLDGNLQTGNFGSLADRLDPAMAYTLQRNPPVVPPVASLVVFGGLGLWVMFRARGKGARQSLSFLGLAWVLMLLWSPGWSPQWILYLIPLILLTLQEREALLMVVTLILVNLLEWPVLLSRSLFEGLWLTVPLRTLLFILLAIVWYGQLAAGFPESISSNPAQGITGNQATGE